ncbi:MAG TPA: hypothetical protein V6C69_20530 [Trichormus sp.]|jgi:hypothetical protein
MFEWRINQIRLSLMEQVLNHMERQGFEVQNIIPIGSANSDSEQEVILAGKKHLDRKPAPKPFGAPAVTDQDIDTIYGK